MIHLRDDDCLVPLSDLHTDICGHQGLKGTDRGFQASVSPSKEVDRGMRLIAEGGRVCQRDPSQRKEEDQDKVRRLAVLCTEGFGFWVICNFRHQNVPPAF